MHPKLRLSFYFLCLLFFVSCDDNSDSKITAPESYTFLRNGSSSVSFSGQTTRILMAEELITELKNTNANESDLIKMFRNKDENGDDIDPFQSEALNESTKSIKSKVAASKDFFFTNNVESSLIKNQFEEWIGLQISEIYTNENMLAAPGVAGQIADGSTPRYINTKGLEYDQVIGKGLIGALMLDQIVNNYLSPAILDEADNIANNDSDILEADKPYTTMEHKWDEAYGYLFGKSSSSENPIPDLGSSDGFLNKYVGRVDSDDDFAGVGQELFDAFKLGRAAIVAKDYAVRDQQADIIKEKLSEIVAIRAVHYLQQGKNALPLDGNQSAYGPAFHDLSEGIGFLYSLRFTRKSGANESYFSQTEVDGFINSLLDKTNGLWEVDSETLDNISNTIADKFDFTVAQAAD